MFHILARKAILNIDLQSNLPCSAAKYLPLQIFITILFIHKRTEIIIMLKHCKQISLEIKRF